MEFYAYCVSRRKPGKFSFREHPVYTFEQLEPALDGIGFIVALQKTSADEVLPTLREKTGEKHVFYDPAFEMDIRDELGYQAFSGF